MIILIGIKRSTRKIRAKNLYNSMAFVLRQSSTLSTEICIYVIRILVFCLLTVTKIVNVNTGTCIYSECHSGNFNLEILYEIHVHVFRVAYFGQYLGTIWPMTPNSYSNKYGMRHWGKLIIKEKRDGRELQCTEELYVIIIQVLCLSQLLCMIAQIIIMQPIKTPSQQNQQSLSTQKPCPPCQITGVFLDIEAKTEYC